jgi:hypothetical protein
VAARINFMWVNGIDRCCVDIDVSVLGYAGSKTGAGDASKLLSDAALHMGCQRGPDRVVRE